MNAAVPGIIAEAWHHIVSVPADQARKGEYPQASPWDETSQTAVACARDALIDYWRNAHGTRSCNAGSNPTQRRLLYAYGFLTITSYIETLRMLSRLIVALFLLYAVSSAADEPESIGRLTFVFGPYVYHFHEDSRHNDKTWLTGLEWEPRGSWLDYGAVFFRNSFYQPSVYAYAGKRWFPGDNEQGTYLKLTAGPLYGYRGQFQDKVPFNHNGLAWAIIPAIGYQYRSVDAQLVFLGGAALLLTFGYDFSK